MFFALDENNNRVNAEDGVKSSIIESESVSKSILNSYTTRYKCLLYSNFMDASKIKKTQKYQ